MVGTRITDGTLLLRLPAVRDADALAAACQDPEIPRWTLVPSPYGREDALAWVEHARVTATAGTELHLLVLDADGEWLLGSVGFVTLDRCARYGEIGYWLAREARGRGVMSRAVELLRDHGARALGLERVELLVHRDNGASRRVAERAGFEPTDLRPCLRRTADGPADHVAYLWSSPS